MASLAYLLSSRLSDLATLTGSSVVSGSPIAYMQNPMPRIRTVFAAGVSYVEGDFGASYEIDGAALGFLTATTSTDTVRFRCKNTYPVTSSPLADSGSVAVWRGVDLSAYRDKHFAYEFNAVTARYFRFDFSMAASTIDVGRMLVGKRVEPAIGVNVWLSKASEGISSLVDMAGMETRRRMGGSKRSIHMEWPAVTNIEALGPVYSFLMERGQSGDFLAALSHNDDSLVNPLQHTFIGCGQLEAQFNTIMHNFKVILDLVEMAPLRMN